MKIDEYSVKNSEVLGKESPSMGRTVIDAAGNWRHASNTYAAGPLSP